MNATNVTRCLLLPILAIAATSRLAAADHPSRPKPNVLFIAIDDLNHWVGHLGRNPQTRTPHLDRMA